MIKYNQLQTELLAGHPVTGAYNPDDSLAAEELNLANITFIKASMSGSDMWANTSTAEFGGLSAAKKSEWLSFCSIVSHVPENNGLAHKFIEYIFGSTSTTEASLGGSRTTTVSRTSQLGFGRRTLTGEHVAHARAL